ncbi:hypothetical protein LHEJCM1062_20250 [Lactobacillus helveticus]|uniref:VOC domain-containing protein n=1 Tax=Lactobacillus helveticus TaxID=1587 RepID=A0AAV4E840_LACHE|nr:hypothetical protein LHEJCM1007_11740 [Lactobacillus helveticus]GFP14153.1 hypothetical protein LHEJCM1062_20250 [Lactobacillus helveticus]
MGLTQLWLTNWKREFLIFVFKLINLLKNVIAKYKSNNQEIISGPVEKHGAHGKMTSVYTRDPDGNLVEVCSYE